MVAFVSKIVWCTVHTAVHVIINILPDAHMYTEAGVRWREVRVSERNRLVQPSNKFKNERRKEMATNIAVENAGAYVHTCE